MSSQLTNPVVDHACFAGRLRESDGAWAWADSDEPLVTSSPTRLLHLRVHDGVTSDGSALVEVPIALARAYDPLGWLWRAVDRGEIAVEIGSGAFRCVGTRDARRAGGDAAGAVVALVPAWRWRSWCCVCATAPTWSPSDEDALHEHARRLGWRC